MENIYIEQQSDTPKVILDADQGLIEFEGKSYPGDAFGFYTPLLVWMEKYFIKNKNKTTVNIKLIYFNSATSQIIYSLLDILEKVNNQDVEINWYYNKENKDTYEDYEDMDEEYESLTINAIAF